MTTNLENFENESRMIEFGITPDIKISDEPGVISVLCDIEEEPTTSNSGTISVWCDTEESTNVLPF